MTYVEVLLIPNGTGDDDDFDSLAKAVWKYAEQSTGGVMV